MGKCVSEISSEPDVASVLQPIDTEALYEELRLTANAGNIMSDEILAKLRGLPIPERERLSFETGSRTVYFPEESGDVVATEEAAALKAMPYGYDISQLNGLNVGCAARTVSPYLISVDIAREAGDATGVSNGANAHAILAAPDDLPFKPESVDFIISLHMLEHICDPENMILYWLTLLKPGGGIGLILPDWRYNWDAASDAAEYGHKWNSEPEVVREIYKKCWASHCRLEQLATTPYKFSFNVVLRKPGTFVPFSLSSVSPPMSGAELSRAGLMKWRGSSIE
jgi:SAM-dependent methyltransferase